MTWAPSDAALDGVLMIDRGEGCYLYDMDGKKYLDFNSSAMCAHLGYTLPNEIIDGVTNQLRTLHYQYPGLGFTEVRAKLCSLLAELCPGDLKHFAFPSTGMEANETGMRIARRFTGRHKILSRYRSYHGSSVGTMAMTGDFRRWNAEAGAHGHIHMFDPYPYSFEWGANPKEVLEKSLNYVRELIEYEGPHTIAAIVVEGVVGTNGILPHPPGYLEGIRELCDEFGILLWSDEVMSGWGRTGRLFGFCHTNVIPDIVTSAKGINGASVPLGFVATRDRIADFFRTNGISIGSTYNSHPVPLASALASLTYMSENGLFTRAAKLQPLVDAHMANLQQKHPSVKQTRAIGLFGGIDIQKNKAGHFIGKVHEPLKPAMAKFKKALLQSGLITMMRGHTVFANPPLVISEAELAEGFDIIDKSLHILDEAMEK
jgi:taurine--2-oxoglutarate transaminase